MSFHYKQNATAWLGPSLQHNSSMPRSQYSANRVYGSSSGSSQKYGHDSSQTAHRLQSSPARLPVSSSLESSPAPAHGVGSLFQGNTPVSDFYYLKRGDYCTPLIPADMLHSIEGVWPREEAKPGMIILPPIAKLDSQTAAAIHRNPTSKLLSTLPGDVQDKIDSILRSHEQKTKVKIYCDKWVHDGICAFAQRGCKFKHEMPEDEATQRSVGLFNGLPVWWKKKQFDDEQNALRQTAYAPSQPASLRRSESAAQHIGNNDAFRGDNQTDPFARQIDEVSRKLLSSRQILPGYLSDEL